jgi:3-dehydroquinate synthetase
MALIAHDKKASGGSLYAILADEIGNAKIEKMSFADFEALVKRRLGK